MSTWNSKAVGSVLLVMIALVVGCANKNDKSESKLGSYNRGANIYNPSNGSNFPASYGYPANVTGGNDALLKALYSADGSPTLPGYVNSVQVNFSQVNHNGAGQVIVTGQEAMTMIVSTNSGGPYYLTLPLQQGTYNGYQLNLIYADSLGSIQIQGNVSGGYVNGQIRYNNQILGSFQM